MIPFGSQHPWFRWISYLNPAHYSFEAIMGAEFGGRKLTCGAPQLIPYGATYTDSAYQSCTVSGTYAGSNVIDGQAYIHSQYDFSEHHVWRNFGILCNHTPHGSQMNECITND